MVEELKKKNETLFDTSSVTALPTLLFGSFDSIPSTLAYSISSTSCTYSHAASSSLDLSPCPSSDSSSDSLPSALSPCPFSNKRENSLEKENLEGKLNECNMIYEMPNCPVFDSQKLSCKRELSSIPKAHRNNAVWEYPSPQQFYNTMKRKNKDVEAEDMPAVVYVHNTVNEKSWGEVLEWEKMHSNTCNKPALSRFIGRYGEMSPKSFFFSKFTHLGVPFDRHDWYVDRCGKTVRYILDFYDDTTHTDDPMNVYVDIRPALDSVSAFWDRLRKPFYKE